MQFTARGSTLRICMSSITYISVDYNITATYPLLIGKGGASMSGLP